MPLKIYSGGIGTIVSGRLRKNSGGNKMRAFFGGQIKTECRGDLAAVVSREKCGGKLSPMYDVFVYPIASEEFLHLTSIRVPNNPIDRVYMGISAVAGNEIAGSLNGVDSETVSLRTIDRLVVLPYFLDKNLEKPDTIVLESTSEGYRIAGSK